jgi:hypothetical protein
VSPQEAQQQVLPSQQRQAERAEQPEPVLLVEPLQEAVGMKRWNPTTTSFVRTSIKTVTDPEFFIQNHHSGVRGGKVAFNKTVYLFERFEITPVATGHMRYISAPVSVFCTLNLVVQPHSNNEGVSVDLGVVLLIIRVGQCTHAFPFLVSQVVQERLQIANDIIIMTNIV